jgi:hypothetical protein
MRVPRAVSLLMAFLLAATMSQVLVAPSQAASGGHTAVSERAKTKVTINFAANGGKAFRLFGKVTPKGKKTATLLRASKARGQYAKIASTKTSKQGSYTFSGLKKEGFYVVRVGRTVSKVIQVCKGGC